MLNESSCSNSTSLLPSDKLSFSGNATFFFVCSMRCFKLLSLYGSRPHVIANKITPLKRKTYCKLIFLYDLGSTTMIMHLK